MTWCEGVIMVQQKKTKNANKKQCVTCAVQVRVGGSMPGAKAWGTGITVLGVGGVDTKASYLTVCTIHHLHKLPTPEEDEMTMLHHTTSLHYFCDISHTHC